MTDEQAGGNNGKEKLPETTSIRNLERRPFG